MERSSPFLDIQEMVREIRERARAELGGAPAAASAPPAAAAAPARAPAAHGMSAPDLTRLRDAARRMQRTAPQVGQMPPRPPGLRARAGAVLVRFVQRLLFWYTPQIEQFHRAAADTVEEQVAVLAALTRDLRTCADAIRALRGQLETERSRAAERETRFQRGLEALAAELAERNTRFQRSLEALAAELSAGTPALRQELAQLRADLIVQDRRLSVLLQEAARRLPEPFSEQQVRSLAEENGSRFDNLYAAFEDTFRGACSDIKNRLRVYLPMLRDAGVGDADMPALDLGCGRGEWLELLGENGMQVRGVDASLAMVGRCESRGLTAFRADAVAYLRSLPAASLGLVTAFHLLEHLPMEQLIAVLDETVRVLKPGGLAIFETPNPDNLLVGATTFYQDPTHLRPLPSNVLKFMAEARGLFRVQILPLHPYPENYHLAADERGLAQRVNELFYGPQDYAIIGRKL